MMLGVRVAVLFNLALVTLLLAACATFTQSGVTTTSHRDPGGGGLRVHIGSANGTSTEQIELGGSLAGATLSTEVTLAVGKGIFKIELLGNDGEVTLSLEASAGETVSGEGTMVADGFGNAEYRVTATEAENVDYTIDYQTLR